MKGGGQLIGRCAQVKAAAAALNFTIIKIATEKNNVSSLPTQQPSFTQRPFFPISYLSYPISLSNQKITNETSVKTHFIREQRSFFLFPFLSNFKKCDVGQDIQ